MTFVLKLLGGARVEADGQPFTGRATQRRRLALLAALALAPHRTLTRERILGLLWPDSPPDAARKLLSEALYVLRRELGDTMITAVGDELTLSGNLTVDVDRLRTAIVNRDWESAVAIYQGPLLDGWFVREAPDFSQWVDSERARLAELHSKALSSLAESFEGKGAWGAAASWWQALIRLDPYRSSAVQRAARALAMAGERATALQLLAAHEALLQSELGVGLDSELASLVSNIRAGSIRAETVRPAITTEPEVPSASILIEASENRPIAGRPWILYGLGLSLFVFAAALVIQSFQSRAADASRAQRAEINRVAVLYFRDESPDQHLGYLADGLTENLIRELTGFSALRVFSQDAVARYRGRPDDLAAIRAELNAGMLVSASIRPKGDSIRIAFRLVDVATGEQIASEVVDGPAGEPVALASEQSLRVAAMLRKRLGDRIEASTRRQSLAGGKARNEALSLLFRAEALRKAAEVARNDAGDSRQLSAARESLRGADSLLQVAEGFDPRWPRLAIARGWVAATAGRLEHGTARVVTLAPGIGHAERALRMLQLSADGDSTLVAQALQLRGMLRIRTSIAVQTFRPESTTLREGLADLRSSLAVDSSSAGAWAGIALAEWVSGNFERSEDAAAHAIEADAYLANAPEVLTWAWRSAAALGRRADAERWCARARHMVPDDWHFVECKLALMRRDAVGLDGRTANPDSAWRVAKELERIDPTAKAKAAGHPYSPYYRRLVVASVLASAGLRDSARSMLTATVQALQDDSELRTDVLYDAAFVRFVLGDAAGAEQDLAAYLKARPDLASYLARDETLRAARERTKRR